MNSLNMRRNLHPTVNGYLCRLLFYTAISLLLHHHAFSQAPFITREPLDATLPPGGRIVLETEFDTAIKNAMTFIGETGDKSTPIPGAFESSDARILIFGVGPLFETTKYWFTACTDFGCANSRTATITVEGGDTGPAAPFEDAEELGEGWFSSTWFGAFNLNFSPWIFHAEHSWMFVSDGSTAESVFLFDLSSESWFFTGDATYPNLYSFGRNSWVFYFVGTSGPRNFVDLVSGEFFDM